VQRRKLKGDSNSSPQLFYHTSQLLEIINFINARAFDHREAFESRRRMYLKSRKLSIIAIVLFIVSSVFAFRSFDYGDKFVIPIQIASFVESIFIGTLLVQPTLLHVNLISLLSNEFRIVGKAFVEVFDDLDEQIESIERATERLKAVCIRHQECLR